MKNLPDQATKAVRDSPDRFGVTQTGRKPPENDLKLTILLSDRSMSELIQQPTHGTIPFG